MQTYDLIMLAVLAAATALGAWKGLAWQVASTSSVVLSYVIAYRGRGPVSELIDTAPPWNIFFAMLILYLATSLLIWVGFHLVRKFIEQFKLKEFDRQIGALVGLGKGGLLCVITTLFAVTLLGPDLRDQIVQSHSGYYIALALDRADAVMPEEVHDVVGPYIHSFEDKLARPDETEFGEGGSELAPASIPAGASERPHRSHATYDESRDVADDIRDFLRDRVDLNIRLQPDG